jgi:hypothetical protein
MKNYALLLTSTLLLVIFLPVNAAASGLFDSDSIGNFLLTLLILIVVFLIFREILCWYWKINERISILKEINRKLDMVSNRSSRPPVRKEKPDEQDIEKFLTLFSNKSTDELEKIYSSRESDIYTIEAIEAAKRLLDRDKTKG